MLTDNDLKTHWTQLHQHLTTDTSLVDYQFEHLTMMYTGAQQTYHNLAHIRQLISLLETHKAAISDPEIVLFAIFFHDMVYNILFKDNEERSAEAAEKYLQQLQYPAEKITVVSEFILATKTHINTLNNQDLDYFLDFDLAILGTAPDIYQEYARQIRTEYLIYPDAVYKPGRKKLLRHFLEAPAIYHTPVFRKLYETRARQNIQAEIDTL
ncbi:putative metal-dependent HD superfamily phosphohydrolase [Chitinophaga polysaccharea]|uniref:Putative metal-dependent HD superfamily phosphohydrolase n=1 Tax=Chitinophaga polysaccharea TaxID=1293035 RepID=A0A561PLP1_9BACT|nr:hypothetical protein [Chitinophaga polysaccharea]TWF39020.1 putative metal-dependent HD superfamily phosphohydrolase [Chitinophaga polysaccharea]